MTPEARSSTCRRRGRLVSDGDHVAIGGCLYSRTPWAMLLELLRAERRKT